MLIRHWPNKVIVLLVLLIAVIGLSIGSVTAKTTTKTKYKTVKLQLTKFDKDTQKRVGKYIITATKSKYSTDQWVYLSLEKGKNKYVKANKYYSRVYYKLNGKTHATKWIKKSSKNTTQSHKLNKNAKVIRVEVKVPSS
jgi:hypothetical protein